MLTFEVLLCFQPTRYSVTMTMSERRRQLTHRRHFRLFVGTTDAAEEVKLSLQQASGFQTDRKHWAVGGGRQKHIKVHQRFSEYTNINSIMPAWNCIHFNHTERNSWELKLTTTVGRCPGDRQQHWNNRHRSHTYILLLYQWFNF